MEWQLYELDNGELHRCPPKDDSYRTVETPEWLWKLLGEHVAQTRPTACDCHELVYVFRGHRPPNGAERRPGPTMVDVARRAGVSPATVSAALNHPEVVRGQTRAAITAAITDLGYVRADRRVCWRRTNFATWLFQPAVTGWYPKKGHLGVRPVPVLGEPWPGSRYADATPRAVPTRVGCRSRRA